MLSQLRGWEWLIIVALIMLLFGAKRLPDAARGLGRSMRIFKAETKGLVGVESKEAPAEKESPPLSPRGRPAPTARSRLRQRRPNVSIDSGGESIVRSRASPVVTRSWKVWSGVANN